ncbi:MAG: 2-deoxy-D-gluconate 3-dehydrogenase [Gammaproteobacteria bacterium]
MPSVEVIIPALNRELITTQPQLYAKVIGRMPLERLGELDDVTGPLVFLASPVAKLVTGQTLYVDGGYSAE